MPSAPNTEPTLPLGAEHGQQAHDVCDPASPQSSNAEHSIDEADQQSDEGLLDDETYVNFDAGGAWNEAKQRGPAIHAPTSVQNIVVSRYAVQWLDLSEPESGFYAKNHMVAALSFAQPWTPDGLTYYNSARLSMELGVEKKSADLIGQEDWLPGDHYIPGEFSVRLFETDEHSDLVVHHLTYNVRERAKIGDFIRAVIQRNMHHFLFLPYTIDGRWKGCGDHLIFTFAVFVNNGLLPSPDSIENPDVPLSIELTYTYLKDGRKTWCRMGRGWWLKYNLPNDPLAPDTSFSEGRVTWQLSPSPQPAVAQVAQAAQVEGADEEAEGHIGK
ncbi:hypothetical protein EV121DRAFT_266363 [Schizophyllum commune]